MDNQPQVTVLAPNGAPEYEAYHPNENVEVLLDHAVKTLGKEEQLDPSGQYILVLGTTKLDPSISLERAGVKPGDTLKIRSKEIPGDGSASGVV